LAYVRIGCYCRLLGDIDDKKPSSLERQLSSVTAVITGALAKPQENIVKAMGAVVQRGLQHNLMQGFREAWQHLEREGRVKPDYLNTFHGAAHLQEVLRALELNDTDQARFEAVQNIFLNGALSDKDKNEILITRLLKKAALLTAGEILMLKSVYESGIDRHLISKDTWQEAIAESTGLKHLDLINEDTATLQDKSLLTKPASALHAPKLTSLARELCEYMKNPIK